MAATLKSRRIGEPLRCLSDGDVPFLLSALAWTFVPLLWVSVTLEDEMVRSRPCLMFYDTPFHVLDDTLFDSILVAIMLYLSFSHLPPPPGLI